MLRLGLYCSALALAATSNAQLSAMTDFVVSGETAYGLMLPETAAGNSVKEVHWSSDGKYLLSIRNDLGPVDTMQLLIRPGSEPAAGEQSAVLYNLATHKQTVVWKTRMQDGELQSIEWFKGSDTAVAVTYRRVMPTDPSQGITLDQEILLIDARTGTCRKLSIPEDQDEGELPIGLFPSPVKPFGFLSFQRVEKTKEGRQVQHFHYRTIGPDGSVTSPVDVGVGTYFTGWSKDGVSPLLTQTGANPDGTRFRKWSILNLSTGGTTPVDKPERYQEPDSKPPVKVATNGGTLTLNAAKRSVRPLWLLGETDDSKAMVAGDVSFYEVSPTLSGVAYVAQGVAMVRPLIQVPKVVFLDALKAAQKAQALSKAKQVCLALIMYGTDRDDTYPSIHDDIGKLLEPYLKNSDIFSGFVYTFPGGSMTDVKYPAETIIGYVLGPGGRANAYADGHARWQDDK